MDVNFAADRSAPYQPSPYPFQNVSQSKSYDQMDKLVLHSANSDVSKTTCTFKNVRVPFNEIRGNCRNFVSSFHWIRDTNPLKPYHIDIEEISQPLSYDSATGTQTKTILTGDGPTYSMGIPTVKFLSKILVCLLNGLLQ
jgi:hypothetical protein